MPEEMMGVYGATSLGELKEIAKDNTSIIAETDEIQASQFQAKQKQESQKNKEPHKVRVSFNINGDEGFTRITMYPLIGKECQQALKNGVEHDRRTGALEVSQNSIDKLSELLTEKNEQLPLEFLFAHVCTPTELIVTDEESDEEIYNDEYEIDPRYGIMSMDEAVDNYEDDEEELEKYKKYLTDTVHIPDNNYISIGIAKTWDKLPDSFIQGEGFVSSVIGETLKVASEDDIALLHGETGLSDSTITFNMEIEDEFDPDKLDFINFDADYEDVSSVLQEALAADFVSMNAIMYDGKMYFAQPQNMDLGENEGDDYYDIVNHHLEGDQKIDIEPESEPKAETKTEVEQKEEPIENGGLFSARLEAMISAALQDGVLTDKERELLKRRVEKEGEDWDEVEMIIEARLAEKNPVAFAPSSETLENNNVSQDTAPKNNKNTEPQDVFSKADNEYPEEYLKKMKITAILPFINRKMYDIERDKLSPRSKIDAYNYLSELSEHVPDVELSVASFITCAEFYETAGLSDNQEAKIREFLQICEAPYVRTNKDKYATSIDIPEGVTIIPKQCFSGCSGLESITLPSTIKQIGRWAFRDCRSLTSIDIPEGVSIIPDRCFWGCSSLESVTLPSTIKQIGENAFYGCSSLISIDIPEGVSILPDLCFGGCSRLESITLPTTIKKIEKRVFYTCYKMKTISIPNGCERIEELSFYNNIEELFLPPTLCAVDVICGNSLNVYCFAPYLEDLHPFVDGRTEVPVYVLPKYFDSYKSQAEAEGLDPRFIHIMPDEYLYYYDN
jgi:hypothetical protein